MTTGQKIRYYRKRMGLTQTELGEKLGVKTNAVSKWECGRVEDIPTSKIKALCVLFEIPNSYLIDDDPPTPENPPIKSNVVPSPQEGIKTAPPYTDEALKLAKDYDDLDGHGKRVVRLVTDEEKARCAASATVEQPQRHRAVVTLHRPFTQVAAAEGAGAFLLDNNYDEVTVELNNFTQKADIILKVVGRSMEPEIHDGDHILVREQPSVEEGEIGVFIIDGNGFLKQAGPDRLISLNPNIEDVIITSQQTAECYGKYICVLNPDWVVEELTAEGAK